MEMTKLEEKLIELGYKCVGGANPTGIIYRKQITEWLFIDLLLDIKRKKIVYYQTIQCVKHPINHTPAISIMEQDLQHLKKLQNNRKGKI